MNIMKLTKKEFIKSIRFLENEDIYFISAKCDINKVFEELKNETMQSLQKIVSERWIMKPSLKIEEKSTHLLLNNSRLDLKGQYYYISELNLLINFDGIFVIAYTQI